MTQIQVALKLLTRGANVFAQNEHGATALHYSSVEGSLEVTKAILEATEVEKLVTLRMCSVDRDHWRLVSKKLMVHRGLTSNKLEQWECWDCFKPLIFREE